MEIIIVEELKNLIPTLKDEELVLLEKSILDEGIREPLIVWGDMLVDGHNRYKIAQEHNLKFKTITKEFEDINQVKLWIIENQLGRRNLSPNQMSYLRGMKYNTEKQAIGRPIKVATVATLIGRPIKGDTVSSPSKTREKIAVESNVSPRTVENDGLYAEAINKISDIVDINKIETEPKKDVITFSKKPLAEQKEIISVVEEKNVPIKEAIKEIKKKEVFEKLNSIEVIEAKEIEGIYDVIVIDLPWPMKKIERNVAPNQVNFDYPTMSIEEMKELVIPTANDCHIWSWTTHKYLPYMFELLNHWELKYICAFVWHKNGGFQPFNLPQYNCEFVLYAHKGNPQFVNTKDFMTCFNAKRTGHSKKPEEFYDVIRRVTTGRRLDMFNRRAIEGFDVWGKEA